MDESMPCSVCAPFSESDPGGYIVDRTVERLEVQRKAWDRKRVRGLWFVMGFTAHAFLNTPYGLYVKGFLGNLLSSLVA